MRRPEGEDCLHLFDRQLKVFRDVGFVNAGFPVFDDVIRRRACTLQHGFSRRKYPGYSSVSGSTSITSDVAPHFWLRAKSWAHFSKPFSSFRLPDLISS